MFDLEILKHYNENDEYNVYEIKRLARHLYENVTKFSYENLRFYTILSSRSSKALHNRLIRSELSSELVNLYSDTLDIEDNGLLYKTNHIMSLYLCNAVLYARAQLSDGWTPIKFVKGSTGVYFGGTNAYYIKYQPDYNIVKSEDMKMYVMSDFSEEYDVYKIVIQGRRVVLFFVSNMDEYNSYSIKRLDMSFKSVCRARLQYLEDEFDLTVSKHIQSQE